MADADSRWIGIRRHQALLVITGLGVVGYWITDPRARLFCGAAGLVLLACAVPTKNGLTSGERLIIAVRYFSRIRWTSIGASRTDGAVHLRARGDTRLHGYELRHRGRLDLSGRDGEITRSLAQFTDALAASDDTHHFSVHVCTRGGEATTLLTLPSDLSAPAEWVANDRLVLASIDRDASKEDAWLLERWDYVRNSRGLIRVLRIRDFRGVAEGVGLLERAQFLCANQDVVLQIDVIGGARAHRLAAQAVHRVGSDEYTSQSAGFRRTARSARTLERLRQREALIEGGAALLRFAAYVVVRAPSLDALHSEVTSVVRSIAAAGLRCDLGGGRQAYWYCDQLPGGPGW